MKKIIFATKNRGKAKEVKHIFQSLDVEIISLNDIDESIEIEETGVTFEENALLKARIVFDKFKLPTIADDSGLVVEQLNGAPGIYSSRYAGDDGNDIANNRKLLTELKKYPHPHKAKFVCSAVYYDENNSHTSEGEISGRIIEDERGTNGFGYDPLFVPENYEKTLAEFESEIKNKISHRYQAFIKLKKQIK